MRVEIYRKIDELREHYSKLINDVKNSNVPEYEKMREIVYLNTEFFDRVTEYTRDIVGEIARNVNSEFKDTDYTLYIRSYWINYDSDKDTFKVDIDFTFTTKMMEIGEACADAEDEASYDACVDEYIDEINRDYMIPVELTLRSDNYVVEVYPLGCDGDYCEVGLGGEMTLYGFTDVKDAVSYIESRLYDIFVNMLKFILSF